MPRVTIPGVGDVMMPDSMPRDQIMARATAMQQAALARQQEADWQPDPRELGIGQLLAGGAKRGYEGLKGTLFEELPALGASTLGYDEFAKRKLGEYQQRMQAAEEESPTAYKSYKDIQGLSDIPGYVAETIGELTPDIASFIGGAGAGELGGKYLAKKGIQKAVEEQAAKTAAKQGLSETAAKEYTDRLLARTTANTAGKAAIKEGASLGSKIGLGTASAATNIPDVFQSIYEDTNELSPGIALTIGSLVAALDTYLPDRVLNQLGEAGKKRIAAAMLEKSTVVPPTFKRAFATEALKTAGGEALTESAQQILQNLASQIAGDKQDFFSTKNVDSIIDSAVKGFIGGGIFGAPGAAVETSRKIADTKQKIAERQAADELAKQQPTPISTLDQIKQQIAANKFKQTPVGTQGELFPELKTQQVTALNTPEAEETHPEPNPAQQELDLQGGYYFPSDEELDAAKQKAEEERILNNKIYQEQIEAEQRKKQKEAEAIQQKKYEAQIRLNDAVAETDARVAKGEIDRRQAARLDLLHPLLENVNLLNTAELFQNKLRDAGYANVELTDTENRLIDRANDVKAAIAEETRKQEATQNEEPSAPNELTPEVTGIAEKGEKGPAGEPGQREPKQLLIPGLPFATRQERRAAQVEPEAEPEPQPESTVLDADTLNSTGLTRQSGFYKQLLNKDLANPEHQQQVANVLSQVRTNPNLALSTKQAIESVAMKAFRNLATQQPLFGPKGGVAKGAERAKSTKRTGARPVTPTTGTSISVSSEPGTEPTGRTEEPKSTTVVSSKPSTTKPAKRKVDESGALKKKETKVESSEEIEEPEIPEHAYTDEEPESEAKPKPAKKANKPTATTTPTPKTEKQAARGATKNIKSNALDEIEKSIEEKESINPNAKPPKGLVETIKRGYTNFFRNDIKNDDDHIAVSDVILDKKEQSPAERAAQTYFKKMPRIIDGLFNISFDLVNNTPQFRSTGESLVEAEFFKGMNGANAKLASDWVRSNLSEDSIKEFDHMLKYFEKVNRNSQDIIDTLGRVYFNKGADETIDDYLQKQEDEIGGLFNLKQTAISRLSNMLHPVIISALENGDLTTALNLLASQSDGFGSKLATQLAQVNENTKVQVVDNLKDEEGNPVAGLFDPKTNIIKLDSVTGLNSHVLLHEPVHAATSHVLDNPSHPVTRQLQQLFDKVKDSISTAYGSTNLQEFVAEAKSNPEFQGLLKSINPDGSKFSAWDRFVRIIGNFLRRMVGLEAKPLESAFDKADQLIDTIMSPSPQYRNAGALYAIANSGTASSLFDKLGTYIEKMPGMNQKRADNVHEFLKNTVGGNFRNFILSTLPLNALSEVAETNGLKGSMEVNKTVNERSGFEYEMNKSIEPLIHRAENFAKRESQAQVDLLNDVIYDSTINKVDPTKPRTEYTTPELQKNYDKLQKKWNKLGGAGKSLYANMRDGYKTMYQHILDSIEQRIDMTGISKDKAALLKRDILQKLATKGNIDPYFPLARYGKYWLSYNMKDKTGQLEHYVEAYETERERERAINEITKDGGSSFEKFSNLSELNYKRAPSGSFVNNVLKIIEINRPEGLSQEAKERYDQATEEVMRLFLSTLPETSFAQSFQRRKDTLGFEKDAVRALREKMYRTSHQIASMRYAAKLNKLLDGMREYAKSVARGGDQKKQQDNRVINEYVKEFEKRIAYINNPTIDKWANFATSVGFNMTLGFNVSSAVINLTQIPLIVFPHLAGKYGYSETSRAIGDAYRAHLNSGFSRTVEMVGANGEKVKQKAMPALDNYNFDDPKLPPEIRRLKTLARIAAEQGQLNRSQLYDVLQADGRNNVLAKVNAASGYIFHHGERLNRQVTLIAAYNLELNRLKDGKAKLNDGRLAKDLTEEEKEVYAANQAIYTSELTNGGITAASAPRIAQNSLGKVLFMFKRYGVSMYYMLFKTAREALKNEDPAVRKAALQQIAGTYGMAALFSGLQGLPLFGIAAMVYNLFADDDDDDFETATRKHIGELGYKGLFDYVTNLETASRDGLNDLIIRDSKNAGSQTFADSFMQLLGGPVYGVASKVERGLSKINNGNIERGIEDILPSALGNILKSARYATQGTTTLRGDPITGEVNSWNIGAQAFGFAPADYTRQLEINSREEGIKKDVNTKSSLLKRQYYTSTRMGDMEAAQEYKQKLLDLGAKHPGLGITPGTINEVLEASMTAQKRATKEMVHGVRYSGKMRKELLQDAAEFDGE